MAVHRLLTVGVACLGMASVLSACGMDRAVTVPDDGGATPACEPRVQWPEWPGALPASLTRDERALFERAWASGPNFACDALLVTRGCGTGCLTGMIHDARSQRTITLPFAIHRDLGQDESLLAFERDSRVLIATGWRNEIEQGVFTYRWDGTRLHPIDP